MSSLPPTEARMSEQCHKADISTGGVAETAMSSDTETSKIDGRPNSPHPSVRGRPLARRVGDAAGVPDVLEVWLWRPADLELSGIANLEKRLMGASAWRT